MRMEDIQTAIDALVIDRGELLIKQQSNATNIDRLEEKRDKMNKKAVNIEAAINALEALKTAEE